ncbi:Csu type fimbrial protein [Alcanivorax sediminis]|uniref:Spore coat protein U/FanG domain-containing protein n=1 Tax=Alcanivorax sediminis TaxID=2663008 RepID=A0A6N7LVZ5_9GAMM|nr:spore coat U domain-containing protein [Alcanivorax sediminis]MQX54572.1 hypothetical protein [Alcanivorax sediminis]
MRALTAFLILLCFPLGSNAAVVCGLTGSPVLDFGTPDPFVGGNITSTATLNWSCTKDSPGQPSFTLCFFVSPDTNGNIDPRYLTNNGVQSLPFNVYSDATYTTVMQPTVDGFPVIVDMPNRGPDTVSGSVTLHGSLPGPLPANVQTGQHQTVMANSQVHIVAGTSANACSSTKQAADNIYTLTAQVNIPNQCQVTATDLDFGTQATPLLQTDSQSSVTVRCTNTTLFSVGLNGGLSGNRELVSGGSTVGYELYQDAGRTIIWNNSTDRQPGTGLGTTTAIQMTVFGRLFANPTAAEGVYTDTVTVDVSF